MGEKEGGMMPEKYFLYGDNHFTLNELLGKPEVLSYLRRNSVEKNRDALRKRLYKGLCNRSINEEVVMKYSRRVRPRVKPAQRTRPVPILRKIMSKLRPTPPPRKRKEKPVPPPRGEKEKPIPPPRSQGPLQRVKPVPPPRIRPSTRECDHGTTEEIDGVTFCIHCGLEIDYNSLQRRLLREDRVFCASRRKDPIFKRRTEPKKPKKEYIPVSPSEVPLLVREEKDKEIKDQILGYLGLLDEN